VKRLVLRIFLTKREQSFTDTLPEYGLLRLTSSPQQLISSFYAFPQFNKKYGIKTPKGSYQVEADWQLGLSYASLVGLIFGVFASGWLGDRFGPRYVMIAAHCLLAAFVAIVFTANTVEVLFVGELLW
jgi:MFS transporter, SP family, general alpha glucoside:H+ symporter